MDQKKKPTRNELRITKLWGKLAYVCKRIHYWWYVRKDVTSAQRYLDKLDRILTGIARRSHGNHSGGRAGVVSSLKERMRLQSSIGGRRFG